MTRPDERTRSVMQAREFLEALCVSEETPGVPDAIRREARRLLRHYPSAAHLDNAAVAWPQTWAPASKRHDDAPSYAELAASFRRLGDGHQ